MNNNDMFKAQETYVKKKRFSILSFLVKHAIALIMLLSFVGMIINMKVQGNFYITIVFLGILCVGFLIKFYQNFDPYDKLRPYWSRNKKIK